MRYCYVLLDFSNSATFSRGLMLSFLASEEEDNLLAKDEDIGEDGMIA